MVFIDPYLFRLEQQCFEKGCSRLKGAIVCIFDRIAHESLNRIRIFRCFRRRRSRERVANCKSRNTHRSPLNLLRNERRDTLPLNFVRNLRLFPLHMLLVDAWHRSSGISYTECCRLYLFEDSLISL